MLFTGPAAASLRAGVDISALRFPGVSQLMSGSRLRAERALECFAQLPVLCFQDADAGSGWIAPASLEALSCRM